MLQLTLEVKDDIYVLVTGFEINNSNTSML